MIPISKAIQIVLQQTPKLASEEIALPDALNRILAEDIVADTDLPPFDRAQMDGYAVRAADVANTPAHLRIVGESAAGAGWHHEMNSGEAVRIMTGAPVPTGADAVQQVELTRELLAGHRFFVDAGARERNAPEVRRTGAGVLLHNLDFRADRGELRLESGELRHLRVARHVRDQPLECFVKGHSSRPPCLLASFHPL